MKPFSTFCSPLLLGLNLELSILERVYRQLDGFLSLITLELASFLAAPPFFDRVQQGVVN